MLPRGLLPNHRVFDSQAYAEAWVKRLYADPEFLVGARELYMQAVRDADLPPSAGREELRAVLSNPRLHQQVQALAFAIMREQGLPA
jgi:hypothetical protein